MKLVDIRFAERPNRPSLYMTLTRVAPQLRRKREGYAAKWRLVIGPRAPYHLRLAIGPWEKDNRKSCRAGYVVDYWFKSPGEAKKAFYEKVRGRMEATLPKGTRDKDWKD